jgi:hypothetical protein
MYTLYAPSLEYMRKGSATISDPEDRHRAAKACTWHEEHAFGTQEAILKLRLSYLYNSKHTFSILYIS